MRQENFAVVTFCFNFADWKRTFHAYHRCFQFLKNTLVVIKRLYNNHVTKCSFLLLLKKGKKFSNLLVSFSKSKQLNNCSCQF